MVEPITKEQAMTEGFDLQNMINSPGWEVIKSEVEVRINSGVQKLVEADASKPNEIMELQHQIRSLRWLLNWPVTMAVQAQAIEKEAAEESTGS